MKVAVVDNGAVSVKNLPPPEIGNGGILVRMESCGICGSDVEKVFGSYSKPSTKLGHEPAGTVLEVGPDVLGISKGDRVFTFNSINFRLLPSIVSGTRFCSGFSHHHVACGQCHLCKSGSETLCEHYSKSNLQPCGLAEEYVVPEWNIKGVLKLPESVGFDDAAMIEPLACCVRAWARINAKPGNFIAIYGAGPTGLLHAMLAKHYRMGEIACIDPNKFRTDFAQKHNIAKGFSDMDLAHDEILSLTDGRGADVSIVATGSMNAFDDAIKSTRKGGTIMMFGVPSKNSTINLDVEYVYSRELEILTSYAASDKDTAESLNLIASGKIPSLDVSQKAFDH